MLKCKLQDYNLLEKNASYCYHGCQHQPTLPSSTLLLTSSSWVSSIIFHNGQNSSTTHPLVIHTKNQKSFQTLIVKNN